jgi:hypothetical protein
MRNEDDTPRLTIGPALDGRRIAIVSSGGHPQTPDSGDCTVLDVEVVDGWSAAKINEWYRNVLAAQTQEPS